MSNTSIKVVIPGKLSKKHSQNNASSHKKVEHKLELNEDMKGIFDSAFACTDNLISPNINSDHGEDNRSTLLVIEPHLDTPRSKSRPKAKKSSQHSIHEEPFLETKFKSLNY